MVENVIIYQKKANFMLKIMIQTISTLDLLEICLNLESFFKILSLDLVFVLESNSCRDLRISGLKMFPCSLCRYSMCICKQSMVHVYPICMWYCEPES